MLSYAYYFKYKEKSNIDFDLITSVAFDAGFDQVGTATAVESITSDRYDGTKHDYGSRYIEQIELQITMVKKDYSNFTTQEKREIFRWLSGRKQASWIELYDEDGEEIIQFFGRFTSVDEKTADSRTIGLIATFTSPYPYGFSPIREIKQTFIKSEKLTVQNDSDVLDDCVRPYFKIEINKDVDELSICNKTTRTVTTIKLLKANEILIIDNENRLVFIENACRTPDEQFLIEKHFSGSINGIIKNHPIFIELVPGENELIIDTNNNDCECTYSLIYKYPMKIGTVV